MAACCHSHIGQPKIVDDKKNGRRPRAAVYLPNVGRPPVPAWLVANALPIEEAVELAAVAPSKRAWSPATNYLVTLCGHARTD